MIMDKQTVQDDIYHLAAAFYKHLRRETHCEYGGWGLDDKRPFGSSFVNIDILDIIGAMPEDNGSWSDEQKIYADALYNCLGDFLQKSWKEYLNFKSIAVEERS